MLGKFAWLGVVLGVAFWFADSVIDSQLGGQSVAQEILSPEAHDVWLRLAVLVLLGAFGAFAQRTLSRRDGMQGEILRLGRYNRLILESVGEGIYGLDVNGRTTFVNPAAARMTGWEASDLMGKLQHTVMHHSRDDGTPYLPEACPIYVSLRDQEVRHATDEVFWRKDGSSFPVEYTCTPMRDESGAPLGAVVTFRDVSERQVAEEAIRESEERYRDYYDHAPTAYASVDPETGTILDCNETMVELFGREKIDIIGHRNFEFYTPESLETAQGAMQEFLATGAIRGVELQMRRGDGSTIDVSLDATAIRDESGRVIRSRSVLRDITDQKRAERERDSMARFPEMNPAPVVRLALDGTVLVVNPAAQELFEGQRLVGQPWQQVLSPDVDTADALRDAEIGFQREVKIGNACFLFTYRAYPEAGYVDIYGADITKLKKAEELLRQRARHDALTSVLNHGAIIEELETFLDCEDDRLCAVAMIDVDGLKAINDTYGHQMGDDVLATVAQILLTDEALVGRYGGDEFIVILAGADRDRADAYCEGVLKAAGKTVLTDPGSGSKVHVKISIGLAIYPEEADTVAALVGLSDHALYASRRQRPLKGAADGPGLRPDRDRTAEIVGDLISFLTSPGDLDGKLRQVAQRLRVGLGYDAVNFSLISLSPSGPPIARGTFDRDTEQLVGAANGEETTLDEQAHPLGAILEKTGRPIIIDDPQNDERLRDRREVMQAAGVESVLLLPMKWEDQLIGVVSVASTTKNAFTARDAQFLGAVSAQVTAVVRMAALVEELQAASVDLAQAQEETVMLLAAAAEAHDATTGMHQRSVRALAEDLARELGWADEEAGKLGMAAVLHDVGKVQVPDSILAADGPLHDDDWAVMKQHTVWGGMFLAGRAGFELAAEIALAHHEQWDGSGYPNGLAGDAISEGASIVAVADAFDAMTHNRPYRTGVSVEDAVHEIATCSGSQFNPRVADALERLYRRHGESLASGLGEKAA